MRKVPWLVGILTVIASGIYIFVYLYRWEWHRALLVGVLFVGAEIALAAGYLATRINRMRASATPSDATHVDPVLRRIRAARPARQPFAWLVRGDHTSVFLPILLGSGVLISAIAWVVEKIAGRSAERGLEEHLADSVQRLSFPREPLVPADTKLLHDGCGDGAGLFVPHRGETS